MIGAGLVLLLPWLLVAAYTAHVAGERGRPGGQWLILGVLLGPLALLAVALAPQETV
jgi:hypothetical protein